MKYRPSLPDNNDNVSHNHPLKEFFVLLSGLLIILLLVFWSFGYLVDFAVTKITPEKEAIIFSKLNINGDKDDKAPSDQQLVLQNITDSLRQCMDVPYPVTVQLIKSKHANAGAFPGGSIVVFSGLLDKIKSTNGVAFVLGHELGHYMNRDHLRSMGRGLVVLALSTIITGANSDISKILAPAQDFGHARYSQKQESAADEAALHALNCYYGHVGGATEFFEVIKNEERILDFKAMHYFSSHPEMKKRIDDVKSLAQTMGFQSKEVIELPADFYTLD